jgi:DNA-binding CsgD family transcriptional regulator
MHVDPNSPHASLTKRQQEVLDRLDQGMGAKEIAKDIGVSRNAVYQHIERLRRQGALAETYTPSGQPPRSLEAGTAVALSSGLAPRESALAQLRELARTGGGTEAEYAELIEGAIAAGDAVGLAYELGRLDAAGETGLPTDLVASALRRLSVLPPGEGAAIKT